MSETIQSPRDRTREIIFEADTKAGAAFDVALIVCILLSVLTVVLDTCLLYTSDAADE